MIELPGTTLHGEEFWTTLRDGQAVELVRRSLFDAVVRKLAARDAELGAYRGLAVAVGHYRDTVVRRTDDPGPYRARKAMFDQLDACGRQPTGDELSAARTVIDALRDFAHHDDWETSSRDGEAVWRRLHDALLAYDVAVTPAAAKAELDVDAEAAETTAAIGHLVKANLALNCPLCDGVSENCAVCGGPHDTLDLIEGAGTDPDAAHKLIQAVEDGDR